MVSILMPVFNAAPFLKECLESIIEQSYEDWELLAVDDYSVDESWTILNEFAKKDVRINILKNSEKGIIPAMRIAFTHSTGHYITRMDADDVMPLDKLEHLRRACLPKSVVTGKVEYFRSDGELGDGFKKYEDWLNGLIDSGTHWKEIYKECVIPSPAWMMRRETLLEIGAFDSDIYPEDYDLVFRMYHAKLEVIALDQVLHRWRDHGDRASRNDSNYSDNRFLDLKLNRFLQIDYDSARPLALWGAGKKGKYCAQFLSERGFGFTWHTDNPKKQGKDIYGVVLDSPSNMTQKAQCLLCMASPTEQEEVSSWLENREDVRSFWLA